MSLNYIIKNLSLLSALLLVGCQPSRPIAIPTTVAPIVTDQSLEAHHFAIDYEQNLIGRLAAIKTQAGDTLPDIARHFGLGHDEIISANPTVDPWLPVPDSRVLLPLLFIVPDVPHQGIVLNLANMRLFHFPSHQHEQINTYPVGIGRDGWNTPLGLTKVISKIKNPTWNVPPSIQREHAKKGDPLPSSVPAGANNPLGEYAMRLALGQYLIHGTNKPYGIGMQMSHGCINLYPEDISVLFHDTAVGSPVMIVNQPYLLGWHHDMLFLEAHKPLQTHKNLKKPLLERIKKLAKKQNLSIDWVKVDSVLQQATGIPTPILLHSASSQDILANALLLPHPAQLDRLPQVKPLTAYDWSITAATLTDSSTAQKLTAMLNHQGPIIPTRTLQEGKISLVIAGPFTSEKETKEVLKRLKNDFELNGIINAPQSSAARAFATAN
jgi:L,D-transpeptidase ErfK/SrfK